MPNDPRHLWHAQPAHPSPLEAHLLRQRARELEARSRRKRWNSLAGVLAIGFLFAFSVKSFTPLSPLLWWLYAVALVWRWASTFCIRRHWMRPKHPASSSAAGTQLDILRRSLRWLLAPMMLGFAAFVLALHGADPTGRGLTRSLPFLLTLGGWLVAYFVLRAREARALQRDLAAFER